MSKFYGPYCYSFHFFYEVKDAEMYGGVGYVNTNLEQAVNPDTFTKESYIISSENIKSGLAKQLKVSIKNIKLISRDEYDNNTKEDENYEEAEE